MNRTFGRVALAAVVATMVAALAACSSGTDAASLTTVTKGKLTIGTGLPAYAPWVLNDKPESGEGFESAVAYAVAEKLGFKKEDVVWVRTSFDQAIAPGPKNFDFNLQQFSITEERKKSVDFSTPYYSTTQTVVTVAGTKAANAKSIADLQSTLLGAQAGTTSYAAITDVIKPTQKGLAFNTNDDAVAALKNGQVDALVMDLPTALYEAAVDLTNGKIVGQLPTAKKGDEFGLVLDKGSALTAKVSAAVDALRTDGTLGKLEQKWLTASAGAPVLK
ncbi:MAG: amino acid ABC transporter substrate-binding protein [Actinobacteria bacterium]|nr:amino acid ABC transporter substrate-binding protein [Actinomycetota bacterium]